jgi:hypothetical protein
VVVIITRVLGRKVRTNKLFLEDHIMLLAIFPLVIRMILIHFVLIYGTNNLDAVGHQFTPRELHLRSLGSKLVLPARIFYAMFIWMSKLTVSEFLKRITTRVWKRSYEITLRGIRAFLFITFFAVVLATLVECHPFDHYWQVTPDPGPRCRQGYAQLLVMGTCDIVTDIVLIAFPIPVVLSSGQTWQRKLQMGSLFSLSVVMIAVTATRMPMVIQHYGQQQYRTVWASCEILASVFVSNAVSLGSFLRDKGTKKNKFRQYSASDSIDGVPTRRATLARMQTNDSDEELFFELGCRVPEHLRDNRVPSPRPAPPALAASKYQLENSPRADTPVHHGSELGSGVADYELHPIQIGQVLPSPVPSSSRSLGFFDVGNLLDDQARTSVSRSTTMVDPPRHGVAAHDFAASGEESHRGPGSRAFLRDMGGILSSSHRGPSRSRSRSRSQNVSPSRHHHSRTGSLRGRTREAPIGVLGPMLERHETAVSLQDPGGLLQGEGMVSHPRHVPQQQQQPPYAPGARNLAWPAGGGEVESSDGDEIEFEDLGGLLAGTRRGGHSGAMTLQSMLVHDRPQHVGGGMMLAEDRGRELEDFEDMVLHDVGGLTTRR